MNLFPLKVFQVKIQTSVTIFWGTIFLFAVLAFPQEQSPTHFKLSRPSVNQDLLNSQANQEAAIVLTDVPRGLFLEGDSKKARPVAWRPSDVKCVLRYDTRPGNRDIENNYPNTIEASGTGMLTLDPAAEGMTTGIYYCILVAEDDPAMTSVEFKVIVQAKSNAIARAPLGNVNLQQGAPTFRWDPVQGVPYYFLFLSEGKISIERNDEGEVTGLSGLNLTWQVITPETFIKFGDPDPAGNFLNAHVPPLLPGIEYNWIVLNSYGPNPDFVSGEVAPVAPSFFTVTRPLLSQKPTLTRPASNAALSEDEIIFEWSPVPDASRYRLFLYETADFQDNIIEYTKWSQITHETSIRLKTRDLLVRTKYRWRVIAENDDGISTSELRPFTYEGDAGWAKFIVKSEDEGAISRVSIKIKNETDATTLLPALTDTFGVTKIALPVGDYTYTASRPGFIIPLIKSFTVPNNDTVKNEVQFERGLSTLSGRVVNESGQGIFNAIAELKSGDILQTGASDADGYFSFAADPGAWALRVHKAEYVATDFQSYSLQENETVDVGEIILPGATNTVTGNVTFSADGKPLQGTFVRAQNADLSYQTSTSSQGGFAFKLGPGTWKITLDSQGFFASPKDYVFNLSENQQVAADFQLFVGGLVYGKITFEGNGVVGVQVQAYRKDTAELVQNVTSNIQGNYSLGLTEGEYEIVISHPNFLEVRREIAVSTNETFVEDFSMVEAGFVQGTVQDQETFLPIAGVQIVVLEDSTISTLTDIEGKYFLGLPPDTPFQIDAIFPGYGSNGPFSVTTSSGETITQDIFLKALSGIIRGQVTDGVSPIPGAEIEITELQLQVLTDEEGRFEFEIPPGEYDIEASKDCHLSTTETANLVAGVTLDLDITLEPLKSIITGKVTDTAGEPIADANIEASGDTVFSVLTDASGQYELCLNGGIFRLTATRVGYFSSSRTVTISDGDSLGGINFILQDNFASVTGVVTDTLDNPVARAVVRVNNANQTLTDTTGEDGAFAINKIIQGEAEIRAFKEGFYSRHISQFFQGQVQTNLDIILFPADGFIRGTVRNSQDNAVIPGVTIRADFSDSPDEFFTTTTDAFGNYQLNGLPVVPNTSYQVFAFKEGFFSSAPAEDILPKTAGVDFLLISRTGAISGRVEDLDTAEPILNARVDATNVLGSRDIAFTDSSGRFDLMNLVPEEPYNVTTSKAGFFSKTLQGISPGDTSLVVTLLRKYGFIKGKVVAISSGESLSNIPIQATPLGEDGRKVSVVTDANGEYLLKLVADFYKVEQILSHHRSEPGFLQVEVAELDTVPDINFALEEQTVQSISIQRADQTEKPSISNLEQHTYTAAARDANNRPVNIGQPVWSLNVSSDAAVIDSAGTVSINHNYLGDLIITAKDQASGVEGHLQVQVFASIDSTTETVLFDDRGLKIAFSSKAVSTRRDLLISKEPLAQAKKGRAEFFTTDSSFIIKPTGLSFNGEVTQEEEPVNISSAIKLMLPPPANTEGQERFIAKWDGVNSRWIRFASEEKDGLIETNILETGEYVALAISKPLAIENLTLTPNPFSPFLQTDGLPGLKIAFDVSSSAAPNPLLTVKVYNLEGNLVRLLHDQTPFPRGKSIINWDGKADNGALARNGRYLVRLIVEDPSEQRDVMKTVVLIK